MAAVGPRLHRWLGEWVSSPTSEPAQDGPSPGDPLRRIPHPDLFLDLRREQPWELVPAPLIAGGGQATLDQCVRDRWRETVREGPVQPPATAVVNRFGRRHLLLTASVPDALGTRLPEVPVVPLSFLESLACRPVSTPEEALQILMEAVHQHHITLPRRPRPEQAPAQEDVRSALLAATLGALLAANLWQAAQDRPQARPGPPWEPAVPGLSVPAQANLPPPKPVSAPPLEWEFRANRAFDRWEAHLQSEPGHWVTEVRLHPGERGAYWQANLRGAIFTDALPASLERSEGAIVRRLLETFSGLPDLVEIERWEAVSTPWETIQYHLQARINPPVARAASANPDLTPP